MDKMNTLIVIFCIASMDLFSGTYYVSGFEGSVIESDSSTIICSDNKTISIVNMTVKQTTTSCSEYDQCSLTDEEMSNIKKNCNDEPACSITSLVPNSCLMDYYGHMNISYSCKERVDCSCNFERGMCGWTVVGPDRYIWQIGKGKTRTSNTGPNRDHTTSTSYGHFIYTESKTDSSLNDESDLLSEWIIPSTKQCLSFWYHMYGKSINKLVVYQMNSNYKFELWNISNNQGNKWYFQSLTLRDIRPYQIKFKAIRGKYHTSDIAIDDIVITNNDCNAFYLQIDCNFETDICKWSKDSNNIYEWIVFSGSTPSKDTGPESDHTLGSSTGHYIYLEASSKDIGTKSNLTSDTVYPNGDACFTFWYYLYGEGMGTLNVYLESEEELTTAWSISGNRNKEWWFTSFDISRSKPYRIMFEGIRGNTSKSDIALDDIILLPGSCGDSVLNCNFEAENCGWKNSIASDYAWKIIAGKTPSKYTGPSADHTSGSLGGRYAYLEGSGRNKGEKSHLRSMTVLPNGDACFTFWYHMYGSGIGALSVYLVMGNTTRKLWENSGNQQNVWRFGYVDITVAKPFMIFFEGIRGETSKSDIALDDMSLLSKSCKERGFILDCNFETGKHNWSSDLTKSYMWSIATGKTKSLDTGPKTDHTTELSNGHYIYLEGTGIPSRTKSELTSTTVNLNGTFCFTFWYHMYGKAMGTLNVYIKSGNTTIKYWSQSGNQGNNWKFANFDILNLDPFNIIFEGIRGDNYTSDIALDDILLLQSSCSGSINYSQSCLETTESISLPECSKHYLQLNNLVFDRGFDNCSAEYQVAQRQIKTLCDDIDNSDICTSNLSEVIKKEPRCFQLNRLLIEYTCEDGDVPLASSYRFYI
ncbi:MAM and LDL-receptor class A domain-containing protein 1-like [Mytilus galloprovincialis]|uniref:MAM and LDL-receptor class A domain-containing protein 1-like n=1 Tax=Mytilus galloprovincialis TaxID=29158 RepID=UPI003F7CAFBE